ncbi:hypothetical protein L1049_000707 [Liquidambar formosana]|uniref:Uncharacterized protein n=1 Tax=Liquidambar formosana TaxID=63359 RepID=A0AAP0NBG9_LIQFO
MKLSEACGVGEMGRFILENQSKCFLPDSSHSIGFRFLLPLLTSPLESQHFKMGSSSSFFY